MTFQKIKLSVLFLLVAVGLTITSCGSEDGESIKTYGLVGTWVSEKLEYIKKTNDAVTLSETTQTDHFVIRFDEDKTGDFISEGETFKYTDTKLTFDGLNDKGEHDVLTVESVGEHILILRWEDRTVDGDDVYIKIQVITFRRQE